MVDRNRIARNVAWNWTGMAVQMGSGFVIAPFLVNRMGETGYGIWILIASLTGYFDVLDLGLRTSVGRNITLYRAQKNQEGVNAVFSTGFVLLCVQALLVVLGTLLVLTVFFDLFQVPPEQVPTVRLALFLVAINLGAIYVFSIFDAVIWSLERFDLLNGVDIPAVLTRMFVTLALLTRENGLLVLAWITLSVTIAAGIAKMFLALWLDKSVRLQSRSVRLETVRSLFGFGAWCFLMTIARTATAQLGPLFIANRLAIGLVTPFSLVSRLVGYSKALVVVSTGVFTPLTTAFHAMQQRSRQEHLFIEGGRSCLALALFFAGFFLLLGKPLIGVWIGPQLQFAWPLLLILAAGELLPMSQGITDSLLLGMARHRALALASIAEIVAVIVLLVFLIEPYGLVGAAIAFAVPGAICRGIIPIVYSCQILEVSPLRYLIEVLVPVACLATLPIVSVHYLTAWHIPANWTELIAVGCIYTVLYGAVAAFAKFGVEPIQIYGRTCIRNLFGIQKG
jgi:O-antigen/teichoic acid export membrane protein